MMWLHGRVGDAASVARQNYERDDCGDRAWGSGRCAAAPLQAVRARGQTAPPEPRARLWRGVQDRAILLMPQWKCLSRLEVEPP